jgi:gliding motility-associated-like protein
VHLKASFSLLVILSTLGLRGQNLVVNGSMTSAKGAGVVAPGWYLYPNNPINTPDVNDSSGNVLTTPGYIWVGGTPLPSPDGGTWQNVFTAEGIGQTINGTTPGATYYFSYYYAAQGISGFSTNVFPPNVTVSGATGYVNPDFGGSLFIWNTYCGILTADSTSIVITASGPPYSLEGYLAYDGFYLSQTPFSLSSPQITKQPADASICKNGDTSFSVQSGGANEFHWAANNGSGWYYLTDTGAYSGAKSPTLTISPAPLYLNNAQYRCYMTGGACPALSSTATLQVFPLPTPSLTINAASAEICKGISIVITATAGYKTYLWSDGSNGTSLIVRHPGTYEVQVTDTNGCLGSDSIEVIPCQNIYFPNAFTPNNDGRNDVFGPIISGSVINYELTVYNRWGQLVFLSKNPAQGWNGEMGGSPQPSGVYVWNCRYQLQKKPLESKTGTVLLIR